MHMKLRLIVTIVIFWDSYIHISITGVHVFSGMTVSTVIGFFDADIIIFQIVSMPNSTKF
jgi:hypothetical protein